MRTLYVPLTQETFDELARVAARELRNPRQQAARFVIDGVRREAERRDAAKRIGASSRVPR